MEAGWAVAESAGTGAVAGGSGEAESVGAGSVAGASSLLAGSRL